MTAALFSNPWLQDSIVTLVAVGAASMIVRRVINFARPSKAAGACGNCPSAQGRCQSGASASSTTSSATPAAPVLIQIRRSSAA